MTEEGKKISFGFSKFVKKTQIVPSQLHKAKPEENNIELIDCFDSKTIKLKNPIKSDNKVLVIPLKRQELDFNNKQNQTSNDNSAISVPKPLPGENLSNSFPLPANSSEIVDKSSAVKALTLDDIAAKEILEDLNRKSKEEETKIYSVPLTNNPPAGEKESSLEDYDNIPVSNFGMAMLRGMGWSPGKGIGKNEKLVTPSTPTLRPKGMGLGADKVIESKVNSIGVKEDLKLAKGGFIRVIAGLHKDSYGQIEGFDDEDGRVIVKLVLKSAVVSLNEFMVQLVDNVEFTKNSKVINVSKYEQYKASEIRKSPDASRLKSNSENNPTRYQGSSSKEKDKDYKKSSEITKHRSDKSNREILSVTEHSSRKHDKYQTNRMYKRRSSCSSEESNELSHPNSTSKPSHGTGKSKKSVSKESYSQKRSSYRNSSSSLDRSDSSCDFTTKEKYHSKKKKSSFRHRSRSRSKSPRKHSKSKKHKKSKSKYSW